MKKYLLMLMLFCFLFFVDNAKGVILRDSNFLTSIFYAQVIVPKGTLNLRESDSQNSLVIAKIPNRHVVTVISSEGSWSKVYYNGLDGFVMKDYLKIVEMPSYDMLSMGDSGDDVYYFKKRLQELGYFKSTADDLSNKFTKTTADRLKIFQKVNGLEMTGIASPELLAYIFSDSAIMYDESLPAAQYYVPATPLPTNSIPSTPQPTTDFIAYITVVDVQKYDGDDMHILDIKVGVSSGIDVSYPINKIVCTSGAIFTADPITSELRFTVSIRDLISNQEYKLKLFVTDSDFRETTAVCSFRAT